MLFLLLFVIIVVVVVVIVAVVVVIIVVIIVVICLSWIVSIGRHRGNCYRVRSSSWFIRCIGFNGRNDDVGINNVSFVFILSFHSFIFPTCIPHFLLFYSKYP